MDNRASTTNIKPPHNTTIQIALYEMRKLRVKQTLFVENKHCFDKAIVIQLVEENFL
jgi:hypothetical protein